MSVSLFQSTELVTQARLGVLDVAFNAISLFTGAIDVTRLEMINKALNISLNGNLLTNRAIGWAPKVPFAQKMLFEAIYPIPNTSFSAPPVGIRPFYFPNFGIASLGRTIDLQMLRGASEAMRNAERTGRVASIKPIARSSTVLIMLLFPVFEPVIGDSFLAQTVGAPPRPLKGFMTSGIDPGLLSANMVANGREVFVRDIGDPADPVVVFKTVNNVSSFAEFQSLVEPYIYCGSIQVADRVWEFCQGRVTRYETGFFPIGVVVVVAVAVGMLLIGVVLAVYYRTKNRQKQKLLDAELERARLEVRENILAMVGHELRTPLLTVSLAVEEIESLKIENSELRSNISLVRYSVDLVLSLIRNILDLNKLEAGSMVLFKEKTSLSELAQTLTTMLSMIAKKNGGVEFLCNVSNHTAGRLGKKKIAGFSSL